MIKIKIKSKRADGLEETKRHTVHGYSLLMFREAETQLQSYRVTYCSCRDTGPRRYRVTEGQSFRALKFQSFRVALLQSDQVPEWSRCRIAKLQSCTVPE